MTVSETAELLSKKPEEIIKAAKQIGIEIKDGDFILKKDEIEKIKRTLPDISDEKIPAIYFGVPSPMETTIILKNSGAQFEGSIMFPLKNHLKELGQSKLHYT